MEIVGILITALTIFITSLFNQRLASPLVRKYISTSIPTTSPDPTPSLEENKTTPTPVVPTSNSLSQKEVIPTLDDTDPWGVAKKVADHTYTMKIENEDHMSTPQEFLAALNDYRIKKGSQPLKWEEKICSFTQERADFQAENGLDAHQGFTDFLENQDGFKKLGFGWLGENASQGYIMSGQHLVEFIFASDEEHNQNQLATQWDRACVSIVNTTVEIIFATSPI